MSLKRLDRRGCNDDAQAVLLLEQLGVSVLALAGMNGFYSSRFLTISGAIRACLKLRTTGLQNRRTRWETDCVAGYIGLELANPCASHLSEIGAGAARIFPFPLLGHTSFFDIRCRQTKWVAPRRKRTIK